MYSMVLMAALTTGTDLPDFGRHGGCCGCYGGYGGYGGCYGCYGGCRGGGYGWGGWGGGYGGYGGGYGGGWGGGWGYGGWGGYSGWGYAAAPYYVTPVYAANTIPASTLSTRSMYTPYESANNRATLTVRLPAKAQLLVDGKPTRSTSTTRRFTSPPLQQGQGYHYILEARMERDGKTVKTEKRVDVQAGDNRTVTLVLPDLDEDKEAKQLSEKNAAPERRPQASNR